MRKIYQYFIKLHKIMKKVLTIITICATMEVQGLNNLIVF